MLLSPLSQPGRSAIYSFAYIPYPQAHSHTPHTDLPLLSAQSPSLYPPTLPSLKISRAKFNPTTRGRKRSALSHGNENPGLGGRGSEPLQANSDDCNELRPSTGPLHGSRGRPTNLHQAPTSQGGSAKTAQKNRCHRLTNQRGVEKVG